MALQQVGATASPLNPVVVDVNPSNKALYALFVRTGKVAPKDNLSST